MSSLAARVAACSTSSVDGTWYRHTAVAHADRALEGRAGHGRWGTAGGFPVLYLGQPVASVVVEAYRHLVDPVENPTILAQLKPRALVTCSVEVSDVLDLRIAANRLQVSLTPDELQSDTVDVSAYAQCQAVAQVAHQLGLHGVVAPSATRRGETLALFTDLLPTGQCPVRTADDQLWARLPPDPRQLVTRHLKVVKDER